MLKPKKEVAHAMTEVYRYVSQGCGVVALVSALKGATNHSIGVAPSYGAAAHDGATRDLLAIGECRSAALLSLAFSRMGLCAAILEPHEIGLRAVGAPSDAAPTHVGVDRMLQLLNHRDLVIVSRRGPGRFPAAEAVMADLVEGFRSLTRATAQSKVSAS